MKVPLPKATHGRVLADWVAEGLREAIFKGHFEPGEKLDQNLIAEDLEVSRTPVREALKLLAADGFVDLRPHRGAFIATISRQDIHEICEIRALLESQAVRQATLLIPESTLGEIERSLNESEARFEAGDIAGHFEGDMYFHETIAGLAENKLLQEILDSLTNRIVRLRQFAQRKPGEHLLDSFKEHRVILDAMRRRDPDAAAEAMRVHLVNSARRLEEFADQPKTSSHKEASIPSRAV